MQKYLKGGQDGGVEGARGGFSEPLCLPHHEHQQGGGQGVPKSTQKLPKLPQSTQKYLKKPKSTSNYLKVPKSISKYPNVPQSTQKYLKVSKSI